MTTITATYSPDDNKLRLTASARLDAETYARVKAAIHCAPAFQIKADFSQASDQIRWRDPERGFDWLATTYQVADAGHDAAEAMRLVGQWIAVSDDAYSAGQA